MLLFIFSPGPVLVCRLEDGGLGLESVERPRVTTLVLLGEGLQLSIRALGPRHETREAASEEQEEAEENGRRRRP